MCEVPALFRIIMVKISDLPWDGLNTSTNYPPNCVTIVMIPYQFPYFESMSNTPITTFPVTITPSPIPYVLASISGVPK